MSSAPNRPANVQRTIVSIDGTEILLFHTGFSIFSNFYTSMFKVDGQRYFNVEQFYQYKKAEWFNDLTTMENILKSRSPKKCKELGRSVENYDFVEWQAIAEQFMYTAVKEKFLQNPIAKDCLLNTGSSVIAEATKYDKFWGTGLDINNDENRDPSQWLGDNRLGKILMQVRECLRSL